MPKTGHKPDMPGQLLVRELRRALHHLYDPAELRKSPLFGLFGLDSHTQSLALRRILEDAVQDLKPAPTVSPHSDAWRSYYVLFHRYVEQFSQVDVAHNLGLSIRQLRRQEHVALQALADQLVERYRLQLPDMASVSAGDPTNASISPEIQQVAVSGEAPGEDEDDDSDEEEGEGEGGGEEAIAGLERERELQWVEQSVPTEPAGLEEVLQSVLHTAEPLAASVGARLILEPADPFLRVTVQVSAVRQALLNLVAAALYEAPGGSVRVGVSAHEGQAWVEIKAARGEGAGEGAGVGSSPPRGSGGRKTTAPRQSDDVSADSDADAVQLASRLLAPSGGTVDVQRYPGAMSYRARVVLSTARMRPVLVIDDNADALQLFQRFLHGSPYQFIGARDAAQALALAGQQRPAAILLDVMLPGIDGWELLGRLREHPDMRGVPIVVCTIMPQERLALTLGAAAFLRKPVNRTALLKTLDQLMRTGPAQAAEMETETESR